ncbi:hypothetical protein Acsp03_71070 [Actinomadura sp. NBRC 104412]|nr:hypothetical protein Acsp03_71070 [Actinomadura sp. NBRC 104412]
MRRVSSRPGALPGAGRPDGRCRRDRGDRRRRPRTGRPPPGHGLIGMRERVAVYGGEFTAGFRVHARLPLEAVPA